MTQRTITRSGVVPSFEMSAPRHHHSLLISINIIHGRSRHASTRDVDKSRAVAANTNASRAERTLCSGIPLHPVERRACICLEPSQRLSNYSQTPSMPFTSRLHVDDHIGADTPTQSLEPGTFQPCRNDNELLSTTPSSLVSRFVLLGSDERYGIIAPRRNRKHYPKQLDIPRELYYPEFLPYGHRPRGKIPKPSKVDAWLYEKSERVFVRWGRPVFVPIAGAKSYTPFPWSR